MDCCGVSEFSGITCCSPESAVRAFYDQRFYGGQKYGHAYAVFTDHTNGKTYGKALAKYIKENGLGTVTAMRSKMNPNSGNVIKLYVWTVNRQAMTKWGAAPPKGEPCTSR